MVGRVRGTTNEELNPWAGTLRCAVVETRTVYVCGSVGAFWHEGEVPGCADGSHEHQQVEIHHHRTPVTLPGGAVITAVSWDAVAPYQRDLPPEFGIYFDLRWQPPWPHTHFLWPDFGVPSDGDVLCIALAGLLERAEAGERVEVGCLGGHGRTGTAVALLAVISGHPADDAVRWARSSYCDLAVETAAQESFVAQLGGDLGRRRAGGAGSA